MFKCLGLSRRKFESFRQSSQAYWARQKIRNSPQSLLSRIFVFSSLCRQLLSIFECFFVLTFCPLDFLSFGQFVLCNICLLMYLLKDTFSWNAWIFYLRKMFVLVYFEVWTLYNFMDKVLPSVNNPVFNKHFPFQTYQYLFSRKISSTPSNVTNPF